MLIGAFNTGKVMLSYSGDTMTHYRFYWGTSQGSWPELEEYAYATGVLEVDIHDIFPSPGSYYVKAKAWNGSEEFADTGEQTLVADIGHFRLRR